MPPILQWTHRCIQRPLGATSGRPVSDPIFLPAFLPYKHQTIAGKLYVEYAKVDPVTTVRRQTPNNRNRHVFDLNGTSAAVTATHT